jgi:hypothetical protein
LIFNSKGIHVGVVVGMAIFDLRGQKLYDLKGAKIYRLSGDLVGHFTDVRVVPTSGWTVLPIGCFRPAACEPGPLPASGQIFIDDHKSRKAGCAGLPTALIE